MMNVIMKSTMLSNNKLNLAISSHVLTQLVLLILKGKI